MAEEVNISEGIFVQQISDLESNFAELLYLEESRSSYSVVTRLRERSARPKELKRAMQQWCLKANPAIEDLDSLSPYLFGMKCYDIDCCTVCDAVNGLKDGCKRFLEIKIEHDAAEKAHADAIEHHKKLMEHYSSRKGRALKAHNGRVSHQAWRVSVAAAMVLNDARSVSSAAR